MRTPLVSAILLALAGSMAASNRALSGTDVMAPIEGFQAVTDSGFNTTVARPAYLNHRPSVLFDEAHNNPDTSFGTYKPFVDLISNDGYKVVPAKKAFSKKSLSDCRVLVIVNASGPPGHRDSSAFTEEECYVVREWLKQGGALLLVTTHAPFSSAASELSKRFDVELTKGFTIDTVHYNKELQDQTEIVFTREDALLGDHPITRGRDAVERINRVISFSGTSLKGPVGGASLLKLSNTAMDVVPPEGRPASANEAPTDHKTVSAAGRAQAIALQFGKGRVVVVGEAAMLTAQITPQGFHFGMNVSGFDNRQLALNIMHWLSGLLK